ncbi:MAG: flagellar biosynthetic protein FliR [Bacillota bacterium]|nr:flagellar biosynthetic protein FliR [Bacillota bacterium]
MDVLLLFSEQLELLMLIWGRVAGLFLIAPVFSSRNIPGIVKIGLSGLICLTIAPIVNPIEMPDHILGYAMLISLEMLIGFSIAFLVQLIFAAIQLAGQLIDMQMGFFIVNVVDPEHGTQVPLIGNYKFLIALIVFLLIDGHHMLIRAIVSSYQFLPIGTNIVGGDLVAFMIDAFRGMFITALQISAPTVGTLFVVTIALGIIARTVPQMNVFVVGMPVNIGIGFIMLITSITLYIYLLSSLFSRSYYRIDLLLNYFK